MARTPETPTKFNHAQLSIIAARLDAWKAEIELAEKCAKDNPLWVFRAKNLERGLKALHSFFDSLQESLDACAAGDPITEQTRKTRGTAEALKVAETGSGYKK